MVPLNLLMSTRPLRPTESFAVTNASYTAQTPHELSFAKGQSLIVVHNSGLSPNASRAARLGHQEHTGYGELPDGTKVGPLPFYGRKRDS